MSILIDKTPRLSAGFTGSRGLSTLNKPLHTALKWLAV